MICFGVIDGPGIGVGVGCWLVCASEIGLNNMLKERAMRAFMETSRKGVKRFVRQRRYYFFCVPLVAPDLRRYSVVAPDLRRYSAKGCKPSLARRLSTLASSSMGCGTFSPFSFRVSIIPYICF